MQDLTPLGPLAALAGTWEGDEGLDVSFVHGSGDPAETRFRERSTFEPIGPVVNGTQTLYGLDYTTRAWRRGEDDPFHMEVGYWLWDAGAGQVMRCFMVPRGVTVLAGGPAAPDAKVFSMRAEAGSGSLGVLSNPHLEQHGRTLRFEVTVTLGDDGTFSYSEDTVIDFGAGEPFHHTDSNTLQRV